jgi:hypothetical protein
MNNLWIQVHLVARLVVVLMDLFYVLFYMRHQTSAISDQRAEQRGKLVVATSV